MLQSLDSNMQPNEQIHQDNFSSKGNSFAQCDIRILTGREVNTGSNSQSEINKESAEFAIVQNPEQTQPEKYPHIEQPAWHANESDFIFNHLKLVKVDEQAEDQSQDVYSQSS